MTQFLYTSPGTYNWICPMGVKTVYAIVIGGGGGGAGRISPTYGYSATINKTTFSANTFSGGGGAGGLGIGVYNVTPNVIYSVVVGSGGKKGGRAGPVGGTNVNAYGNGTTTGSPGGTSSFSSFLTSTGGTGGPLLPNSAYYDSTPGGTSYGYNMYGADGGKGGGFRYNPITTTICTDGFATGGGGLCGADGGHIYKTYNGVNLTVNQYQQTCGGGMYPKGSAGCSSNTNNFCVGNWGSGINYGVDWRISNYATAMFDAVPTLFSGVTSSDGITYDANGLAYNTNFTFNNSTGNYFGGQYNRVYKSTTTPPHLELLQKLFKLACGSSGGASLNNSTSGPLCYTITGGSGSGTKASSSLLTGGTGAVGSTNASSWANTYSDCYTTGFGCGGGGAHTYVYDTSARPEQNGIDGGNGLVYLEWS